MVTLHRDAQGPSFSPPVRQGVRTTLKPKTVEAGVRRRSGGLHLTAVGDHVDFANRLLTFACGAGIIGTPRTLNNTSDVESYGAVLAATHRGMRPLTPFASYSYNKATYEDDVRNAAGTVLQPIGGETVIDTPEHQEKGRHRL